MENDFKHLENTLIEIPKDTIARWVKDAQNGSTERYGRVESSYVELYLGLKTEGWRMAERTKNSFNEMALSYSGLLRDALKKIEELEIDIDRLKNQIRH